MYPNQSLKDYLDEKVEEFNHPSFIDDDPISVPHAFSKKQDIEIAGFFAATLAWGQRRTIISKCNELFNFMGRAPHDFMLHHSENDLKDLLSFKHRTFNATDLLWFVSFFNQYYKTHDSLEWAFSNALAANDQTVEAGLNHFNGIFFAGPESPERTRKHVASPARGSACKRLNMYLRWMVRSDENGVDFGIWKTIKPSQLVCPCDLHVDRIGRKLGLIHRKQTDWQTALELTGNLRLLDPLDPVKYDFALFGIGVMEKVRPLTRNWHVES